MPLLAPVTTKARPDWSGISAGDQELMDEPYGSGVVVCRRAGGRGRLVCCRLVCGRQLPRGLLRLLLLATLEQPALTVELRHRGLPPIGRGHACLELLDVRGGGALCALLGVVAHLRALGERLEAVPLDRAVMHEQILARVIRRDEAEALLVVEPLHSSCRHLYLRFGALAKRGGRERQRLRKRGCTPFVERMLDSW